VALRRLNLSRAKPRLPGDKLPPRESPEVVQPSTPPAPTDEPALATRLLERLHR
jgi:hypothetical protein